jgi:hypothetical protein
MSERPIIAPEDCPEPFWHETHRYCPICTWVEPEPICPTRAPSAVLAPDTEITFMVSMGMLGRIHRLAEKQGKTQDEQIAQILSVGTIGLERALSDPNLARD